MGGHRNLAIWLEQPSYSHQSRSNGMPDKNQFVDRGWVTALTTGQRAKFLLGQDLALLDAVWHEVFLSVCPKGMTYDEGVAWAQTPAPSEFDPDETLYRALFEDKEWEAKCNTCHKRFLLEVNLRTNEVRRIKPSIDLRGKGGWVVTGEIDPALAIEYYHDPATVDDIPF